MKKRLILILASIMIGCILMSGGYGIWEKELTIRGSLTVVAPPPPPTPVPTLEPTPAPAMNPAPYPEPSPVLELTQEDNQMDLVPPAPEPEETVETLPEDSDADVEESTGTDSGAAEGGTDSDGTVQDCTNDTYAEAENAGAAGEEGSYTGETNTGTAE